MKQRVMKTKPYEKGVAGVRCAAIYGPARKLTKPKTLS